MVPARAVIPIAASDVPVATLLSNPRSRISSGTITIPPPTPKRALNRPATSPMARSFSGTAPYPRRVDGATSLLARLTEAPERAAVLLDVDGVLAPIVDVPHEAAVPPETRDELRRLHGGYALVACISGRSGSDARRVVGLDELVYVGQHGLELEPEAIEWGERLQTFAASVDWEDVERKPLTVSFHYRRAADEDEALTMLNAVAARARHEGMVARFGRKVLELRPPVGAHKGTAVAHLLGERGLDRAVYAGDDTTDLDAFIALGDLELGVRVAVASHEGPVELREAADVIVDGPAELLQLLRRL